MDPTWLQQRCAEQSGVALADWIELEAAVLAIAPHLLADCHLRHSRKRNCSSSPYQSSHDDKDENDVKTDNEKKDPDHVSEPWGTFAGHVRHMRQIVGQILSSAAFSLREPLPLKTSSSSSSTSASSTPSSMSSISSSLSSSSSSGPSSTSALAPALAPTSASGLLPADGSLDASGRRRMIMGERKACADFARKRMPAVSAWGSRNLHSELLTARYQVWLKSLAYTDHMETLVNPLGTVNLSEACEWTIICLFCAPLFDVRLRRLDITVGYPRRDSLPAIDYLMRHLPRHVEGVSLNLLARNDDDDKMIISVFQAFAEGCSYRPLRSIKLFYNFHPSSEQHMRRLLPAAMFACDELELAIDMDYHEEAYPRAPPDRKYTDTFRASPWPVQCQSRHPPARISLITTSALSAWWAHPAVRQIHYREPEELDLRQTSATVSAKRALAAAAPTLESLHILCLRASNIAIQVLPPEFANLRALVVPITTRHELDALVRNGVLGQLEHFGTSCLSRSWADIDILAGSLGTLHRPSAEKVARPIRWRHRLAYLQEVEVNSCRRLFVIFLGASSSWNVVPFL